jgi:hypothetical protein
MLKQLGAAAFTRVFGDGLVADLAARGTVYLADGARQSLDHPDERLTSVRLRPGETYTVIARPPASRRERKLAARERALRDADRRLSRPTRRQVRAARQLERVQVRLDRSSPDGRRHRRLAVQESRRGERFDKVMRPTRRQARAHAELADVTTELDATRAASFERARARRGTTRRSPRSRIFD